MFAHAFATSAALPARDACIHHRVSDCAEICSVGPARCWSATGGALTTPTANWSGVVAIGAAFGRNSWHHGPDQGACKQLCCGGFAASGAGLAVKAARQRHPSDRWGSAGAARGSKSELAGAVPARVSGPPLSKTTARPRRPAASPSLLWHAGEAGELRLEALEEILRLLLGACDLLLSPGRRPPGAGVLPDDVQHLHLGVQAARTGEFGDIRKVASEHLLRGLCNTLGRRDDMWRLRVALLSDRRLKPEAGEAGRRWLHPYGLGVGHHCTHVGQDGQGDCDQATRQPRHTPTPGDSGCSDDVSPCRETIPLYSVVGGRRVPRGFWENSAGPCFVGRSFDAGSVSNFPMHRC